MAQGNFKQKKAGATNKKAANPLGLKKGAKVIAPKKKQLVQQQKSIKKLSAGLTAKTERMLAERAGHLEILAGGKKSKAGEGKGAKAKK